MEMGLPGSEIDLFNEGKAALLADKQGGLKDTAACLQVTHAIIGGPTLFPGLDVKILYRVGIEEIPEDHHRLAFTIGVDCSVG